MELSNGRTLLKRNHSTSGIMVHDAGEHGRFVNLYCTSAHDIDNNSDWLLDVVNNDDSPSLRISIGMDNVQMCTKLTTPEACTQIAKNIYVHPHEQIWISCSSPNKFVVHGIVTKTPL